MDPMEAYVQLGLDANPALLSARATTAASEAAFAESRYAYMPSVGLQSRYTRSAGGRTIEFPVGDLLNPVYGALNEVNGSSSFPTIENEQIRFLRKTEQETKANLVQPLFLPGAAAWRRAAAADVDRAEATLISTERDVAAGIRDAYLAWLQAGQAVVIVQAAETQLLEAHRATSSLVENGLATNDALFRIEADLSGIRQRLAMAENQTSLASAALNTLLARPIDTPVESADPALLETNLRARGLLEASSVDMRPELKVLDAAENAAAAGLAQERSSRLPQVVVAADWGVQGTRYTFSDDSDFRTASVVATWTLFDGRRRSARIQRAEAQQRQVSAQRAAVRDQLELEVQAARWRLDLAESNVLAARDGRTSAASAFRLTERRYTEGLATVLELLDARRTLTLAEQQLLIARMDVLRAHVELLRVTTTI